jgi:hypothetical protein
MELYSKRTGLSGLFCETARDEEHQKELIADMMERIAESNKRDEEEKE